MESADTSKLIAALEEMLHGRGWQIQSVAPSYIVATQSEATQQVAWVDADAELPEIEVSLIVRVRNDSRSFDRPSNGWASWDSILKQSSPVARSKRRSSPNAVEARLVRDLLLSGELRSVAPAPAAPSTSDEKRSADIYWLAGEDDSAAINSAKVTLGDFFGAERLDPVASFPSGRGMIFAHGPDLDLRPVAEVGVIARLKHDLADDDKPFVAPIALGADEVAARGIENAMGTAFWEVTGISHANSLSSKLAQLGYVRLFVFDVHRLRTETYLDPNTSLLGDVMGACPSANLNLFCRRSHVLQSGLKPPVDGRVAVSDPWRFSAVRAVGERFLLDERLAIVSCAALDDPTAWARLLEAEASEHAAEIAELTGGRLSQVEARLVLQSLAVEWEAYGELLDRNDFHKSIFDAVAEGERKRAETIAFSGVAAAVASNFQNVAGRGVGFRSDRLVVYLLARDLCDAILIFDAARATPHSGSRLAALRIKLSDVRYPDEALEVAMEMIWHRQRAGVSGLVATLLRQFNLTQDIGGSRDRDAQRIHENLFSLLFAAVDVAEKQGLSRTDFLRSAAPESLFLHGLALPQAVFRDVDLEKWRFTDCNLRRAVFFNAKMKEIGLTDCNLSGSVFFGGSFRSILLTGSNLSGAWFRDVAGMFVDFTEGDSLPDGSLKGSIWMAAGIADEAPAGLLNTMRKWGATPEGLSVQQPGGDVTGAVERGSLPMEIWRAVLGTSERALRHLTIEDDKPSLRSLAAVKSMNPEGAPVLVRTIAVKGVAPKYWNTMRLSNSGELILCREQCQSPHVVLRTSAKAMVDGCARQTAAGIDYWFVAASIVPPKGKGVSRESSWQFQRARASVASGDVQVESSHTAVLPNGLLPTCVELVDLGGSTPHAIVGGQDGSIWALPVEAGDAVRIAAGQTGRGQAVAVGFMPGAFVLVHAHFGGLVVGERLMPTDEGGLRSTEVFRFRTAVGKPFEIVPIEIGQQFLLVGEIAKGAGDALCVLFSAAGAVSAVFSRPIPYDPSVDPTQTDFRDISLLASRDSVIDTQQRLGRYASVSLGGWVNPFRQETVGLAVQAAAGAGRLDRVLRDNDGDWFRQASVSIVDGDGELLGEFSEKDLEVTVHDNRLDVVAPTYLISGASQVTANLSVGYRRAGSQPAARVYPFDLSVTTVDNPFDTSGRPVIDEGFWGRRELLDQCEKDMLAGNHIVVRGARRMGKTSLLQSLAARLRAKGRLSVAISLLGMQNVKTDFASAIAREIERTIPNEFGRALAAPLRAVSGRTELAPVYAEIGQLAERAGWPKPFALIIDEWGVVSNRASQSTWDSSFLVDLGERIHQGKTGPENPVAFCLSGTPADFVHENLTGQSDPYRSGMPWYDIGPISRDELRDGVLPLLAARRVGVQSADDLITKLYEWSSGDAHAASLLMRHAFEAAQSRGRENILIGADDIARPDAVDALRQHYSIHRSAVLSQLSAPSLNKLAEIAMRTPEVFASADGMLVPSVRHDPMQLRVFDDAGFRRCITVGRDGQFAVWLPRGMTLDIIDYAGGGNAGT